MRPTPDWWQALLLAAAAFRIYHLLAADTILDRPRKWALGLPSNFDPELDVPNDKTIFPNYREHLATWLTCPWCAGFWISVAWWAAWETTPKWTTAFAVPWALSATVALVAKHLE